MNETQFYSQAVSYKNCCNSELQVAGLINVWQLSSCIDRFISQDFQPQFVT